MLRQMVLFVCSIVMLLYSVLSGVGAWLCIAQPVRDSTEISQELKRLEQERSSVVHNTLKEYSGFNDSYIQKCTEQLTPILERAMSWQSHNERVALAQKFLDENFSTTIVQVFMSDAVETRSPGGIALHDIRIIPLDDRDYAGVVCWDDGSSFGAVSVVLFEVDAQGAITNLRAYDELT